MRDACLARPLVRNGQTWAFHTESTRGFPLETADNLHIVLAVGLRAETASDGNFCASGDSV